MHNKCFSKCIESIACFDFLWPFGILTYTRESLKALCNNNCFNTCNNINKDSHPTELPFRLLLFSFNYYYFLYYIMFYFIWYFLLCITLLFNVKFMVPDKDIYMAVHLLFCKYVREWLIIIEIHNVPYQYIIVEFMKIYLCYTIWSQKDVLFKVSFIIYLHEIVTCDVMIWNTIPVGQVKFWELITTV